MTKNLSKEFNFPIIRAIPLIEPDLKKVKMFFWRIKEFFTFRRKWIVKFNYFLWSDYLQNFIYIPAPFIFDGASVPKIFYSFFSPMGILLGGALPHDFGYKFGGLFILDKFDKITFEEIGKKQLDKIFMKLIIQENGFKKSSKIATFMLKFGYFTWKKYRKINAKVFSLYPYLKSGDE